jgi:hypothetical protein
MGTQNEELTHFFTERPPMGQILFKQLTNGIAKSAGGGTNKCVNKTHH